MGEALHKVCLWLNIFFSVFVSSLPLCLSLLPVFSHFTHLSFLEQLHQPSTSISILTALMTWPHTLRLHSMTYSSSCKYNKSIHTCVNGCVWVWMGGWVCISRCTSVTVCICMSIINNIGLPHMPENYRSRPAGDRYTWLKSISAGENKGCLGMPSNHPSHTYKETGWWMSGYTNLACLH